VNPPQASADEQNIRASSVHARPDAGATQYAKPLAQEYVVVARVPSPGLRTDDCALTHLPGGGLLATFTFRQARGSKLKESFHLARSRDNGQTWERLPPLDVEDGMPFVHNGKLYLLGNGRSPMDIVVTRSDDDGQTWLKPVPVIKGCYWNAPTGYAIANGHLYRAFDVRDPKTRAWVGAHAVVAGDLSRDLLDPASWRVSKPVRFPGIPETLKRNLHKRDNRWLEPNVVSFRGKLHVLSRVRIDRLATANMCAVCDVKDDGKNLDCRFVQFHPMPGGQCKFFIIHDKVSDLFWSPVNLPTNTQDVAWGKKLVAKGFRQTPGNERRFLMLMYSLDALNWFQAGCIAMSTNPLQSFHYAAPLVDGDDLLILSRTSRDAPDQHDSDLVTFHRVKNFRRLALKLHPEM